MPVAKSDLSDLMVPGLRAEFALAYRSELDQSVAEQIATIIQTTKPIQKYGWLGAPPPMREFLDERRPSGLGVASATIEDKVFESSLAVERRAMEDDQLELIRLRVRDLAFRVATHRQQMVVEALSNGATALAYDGQTFFNTGRTLPTGATWANRTLDPLSAGALATGINQMMLVPDDTGTPLGISPDTLVVGPKNQWLATELLQSPVVVYKGNITDTSGATPYLNAFHGRFRLLVSPFLQGLTDDHWFLLDTKRPIRGVILQQRSDVPVEFSAMEAGNGSDSAWFRDRYHYGVRARYNVGYGLWQTAYAGLL